MHTGDRQATPNDAIDTPCRAFPSGGRETSLDPWVARRRTGSAQIADNIASVAEAAVLTTQGAHESREAVDDLARMSTELKTLVAQFTC